MSKKYLWAEKLAENRNIASPYLTLCQYYQWVSRLLILTKEGTMLFLMRYATGK